MFGQDSGLRGFVSSYEGFVSSVSARVGLQE